MSLKPRTMLLATDLSSRCDRALDRASELAKSWGARLIVLTVVEEPPPERGGSFELPSWRRPPDRLAAVTAQLQLHLAGVAVDTEIRVLEGEIVESILQVAQAEGADLIVTGIARDETLGRYFLGSTVDRLAPSTPVPLLTVKSRLRPYREVLVATDFSPRSRHALTTTIRMFSDVPMTVMHGWQVPFAGFLDKGDFRAEWRDQQLATSEAFLREVRLATGECRDLKMLLEHGSPEAMISAYLYDHDVGLVVAATHNGSGPLDRRLGGTAKRILEVAPADVMLVPESRQLNRG